ncbi:hypothetical protein E1264_29755 [Actinomadura sp. KC216]|uniref:hypothetical protein n=1 Tax=Actinomadura sp. KC216 TaxID=2530370 RepID=UPI0010473C15|nr:hypothetical protein [Actinomadura sp. KC216]TDB83106.1 hypothetical protein E1264_29755 [Actinomadura sp. KC216]
MTGKEPKRAPDQASPPYLGQGGGRAMMSALGPAGALSDPSAPVDRLLPRLGVHRAPDHRARPASRVRAALTVPTGAGRFAGASRGQ